MSRSTSILFLALALLLASRTADAALTTGKCLALKRQAWGDLRKCQATEESKQLKGKTADLAKCQAKFQEKLAKITAKATKAAVACRYLDNGDGTVTDHDTGLQWEKKNGEGGGGNLANRQDVDNGYFWSANGSSPTPSGTVFTDFLGTLNTCTAGGIGFELAGFALHCDWRLPTRAELEAILLAPDPCGTNPCIDATFGPTASFGYWTATTNGTDSDQVWSVRFDNGSVVATQKVSGRAVRAVRNDL